MQRSRLPTPKSQKGRRTEFISELIGILEDEDLAELSFSEGDFSVTIKAPSPGPQVVVAATGPVAGTGGAPQSEALRGGLNHLLAIKSPMTGIFYRSPAPDEPAFVEIGETVEVGQTIGLVEAMKVFSEIPSEVAGQVVEIAARDGELVPEGAPLMVVDPSVSLL